jgi:hypothetical protein
MLEQFANTVYSKLFSKHDRYSVRLCIASVQAHAEILYESEGTSTGTLLDSLPRNEAAAEFSSGECKVANRG